MIMCLSRLDSRLRSKSKVIYGAIYLRWTKCLVKRNTQNRTGVKIESNKTVYSACRFTRSFNTYHAIKYAQKHQEKSWTNYTVYTYSMTTSSFVMKHQTQREKRITKHSYLLQTSSCSFKKGDTVKSELSCVFLAIWKTNCDSGN